MRDGAPRATIREYVRRGVRYPELRDDEDLFENGIANSIFAVELVGFIEERFAVTVEDQDLEIENFCSVDALTSFVERKTGTL